METALSTVRSILGNNVANYLEANCAGWVIERFADTRTVKYGPHAGKIECLAFAASDIGQSVLLSSLTATNPDTVNETLN